MKLSLADTAGGGSDHAPFMAKMIPGVFFHTGIFDTWHQTSDNRDVIDYKGMTIISKIAFDLAQRIANESSPMTPHRLSMKTSLTRLAITLSAQRRRTNQR